MLQPFWHGADGCSRQAACGHVTLQTQAWLTEAGMHLHRPSGVKGNYPTSVVFVLQMCTPLEVGAGRRRPPC